ncbi:MAG TPA: hypothetical protein VHU44_11870 [Acidobacteriaceae bacterium]|jgi:hypothetical protein|nr:hypothetical protein [Acidobacteriaceae bacterium]
MKQRQPLQSPEYDPFVHLGLLEMLHAERASEIKRYIASGCYRISADILAACLMLEMWR